jgi:hypothetical protein
MCSVTCMEPAYEATYLGGSISLLPGLGYMRGQWPATARRYGQPSAIPVVGMASGSPRWPGARVMILTSPGLLWRRPPPRLAEIAIRVGLPGGRHPAAGKDWPRAGSARSSGNASAPPRGSADARRHGLRRRTSGCDSAARVTGYMHAIRTHVRGQWEVQAIRTSVRSEVIWPARARAWTDANWSFLRVAVPCPADRTRHCELLVGLGSELYPAAVRGACVAHILRAAWERSQAGRGFAGLRAGTP